MSSKTARKNIAAIGVSSLFVLFNILALLSGPSIPQAQASHVPFPVLGVFPEIIGAGMGRGDSFSITVNATEVGEFNAYDIGLEYTTAILAATGVSVLPVLGQTFTELIPTVVDDSTGTVRVVAGITGGGRVKVDTTSEPLFRVSFVVDEPGTSRLDLVNDRIVLGADDIPHETRDGVFSTTGERLPIAQFTFFPSKPIQGQLVTFDASASNDPDGTIVSYFWRWGQEAGTTTTTNPVVTHIFRDNLGNPSHGSFTVTLIVTDNSEARLQDSTSKKVDVSRLPFRDLLIGKFDATPTTTNPGKLVKLSVTVVNSGTFNETLDLNILVRSTQIASRNIQLAPNSQTSELNFDWDTSGFAPDVYLISLNVTAFEDEAVVYSLDALFDAGEPVLIGEIAVGSAVKGDSKIGFVDFDNNGLWTPGETVFYDINVNGELDAVDPTIRAGSTSLAGLDDPKIRFVDANNNNVRDSGEPIVYDTETVVYDSDGDNAYDNGEVVISGSTPTLGATLKVDLNIKYVDSNNNNVWDPAETVVYDVNSDGSYNTGEPVIAGATPTVGTLLKDDAKIKYVDSNSNNVWDSGGDGRLSDGDVVISGATPPVGTLLKDDPRIRFVDADNNNAWTTGEVVWSDTDSDGAVDPGEQLANPKNDPSIKFADSNNNNAWNFAEADLSNNSDSLRVNLVSESSGLTAFLIAGSGIGVLGVAGVLVWLVRRRKRADES